MKTMAITKFKAYALKIIDQVAKSNESLVITKRGKPLAELILLENLSKTKCSRKLADALVLKKTL